MNFSASEQRESPRYRYRCYAKLCSTGESWPAHLLNISENGALIAVLCFHGLSTGDQIELTIELDAQEDIELLGHIAHIKEHYVGIRCEPLGPENRQLLTDLINNAELDRV